MDNLILVLPSGDPSAIGTPSDFTIQNINLSLDPKGVYQASLIDVSFANPGASLNSVFVSVDFLENQLVGNKYYPILYKTAPMTTPIDNNDPATKVHYEKEVGTIQQWRQVQKTFIDNIRVQINQSTGTPVPHTSYSMVQLMIQRIA